MVEIARICSLTNRSFIISIREQEHIRKFESLHPLLKEGDIPLPTLHPLELMRQMQSYVTLAALFNAKSAISGKDLITRYNPSLGYKVCTQDEFWSDVVDNVQVGRAYDFSRPFFEQWNELMREVYMQPLVQIHCENSPYVDASSNLKNCYMCFGVGQGEDCFYCIKSRYPLRNRDCVDCVGITDCELCYSCVETVSCYSCQHCQDSSNSRDCFGSYDLIGCKSCFGCYGLRHQEFMVFNQQVTAEEYEKFIQQANLGSYTSRMRYLEQCETFLSNALRINTIRSCENSSGKYLSHSHNAYQCYFAESLEDCGWSTGARGKDVWRGEVLDGELAYNSVVLFGRLGFCNSINTGSENFYSYMIFDSSSCFGCAMLKKKSYCILNKQYSKEEYDELMPKIIQHMKSTGEWGQFLPPQYAPHFYHESQAATWVESLSREELKRRDYRVNDVSTHPQLMEFTVATLLPDAITDADMDSLLAMTVTCSITGKAYRFDRGELLFYKQQQIPLPRVHWEERLGTLMKRILPIP